MVHVPVLIFIKWFWVSFHCYVKVRLTLFTGPCSSIFGIATKLDWRTNVGQQYVFLWQKYTPQELDHQEGGFQITNSLEAIRNCGGTVGLFRFLSGTLSMWTRGHNLEYTSIPITNYLIILILKLLLTDKINIAEKNII